MENINEKYIVRIMDTTGDTIKESNDRRVAYDLIQEKAVANGQWIVTGGRMYSDDEFGMDMLIAGQEVTLMNPLIGG